MEKCSFTNGINSSAMILITACLIFFSSYNNSKSLYNKTASNISLIEKQTEPVLKASLSDNVKKMPLYGFNGNNIKGPSWTNSPFRDSATLLHFKIIRYPGGTVGNWWDWQKGWFVDHPALPDKFKKMNYVPNGLKELKLLVDETKCDVMFTLNMTTSTLNDQLQMLIYAQSLKIPIKWVELGNELNNFKNYDKQKFPTVANYGKICKQWIDTIKSHFPNAKIAVIGGNRSYNADVKNWNDIILKNAPNADAIVAHLYPKKENIIDDSGINFQKLFDEFINDFSSQDFTSIRDNKDIWITEYNIMWASNEKNKAIESKANTWSQALATLLMTSIATSIYPNTNMIVNHNISGVPIFAAIETEKRSFQKLPNGIGMAAWLTASDQMDSLTKINFKNTQPLQDYQLFGWKFSNNKNSSLLLVNLSEAPVKINVSNLIHQNATFEIKYADKNAEINGAADVNFKTGVINNGLIELLAYSVTIIKAGR